jgi:nucleotide-binding universal stress UspA family protein
MSEQSASIETILVGIDGSKGSAAALRRATSVAMAASAEVLIVHVIEPPRYDTRALGLPRAILNEAGWRDAVATEIEGTWCEPLRSAGVRYRTRIEEGRPGPCLTDTARQEHADLIVTGRRGLSSLAELVQGRVSSYVTHHASCPVAVVPTEVRAA